MTGSLDRIKRLLGGGLVALLLTAVAGANTLTKVRAAASDDGAPLICCLTDQCPHQIIAAISPGLLSLLGTEEVRSIQGGDPAAAAFVLSELSPQSPGAFAASPPLLWSAAAFRQALDQLQTAMVARNHLSAGSFPAAFEEDLLRQFGDSLYKVQRYAEAVAAYQSALEQATTIWHTGWTLYHLGKSYEALGLYGEASFVYQELTQQADVFWSELGQQALTSLR